MPNMPIDAGFDLTLHAGRASIAEPQDAVIGLGEDCKFVYGLYLDREGDIDGTLTDRR
jgi:hypothetical protein